MLKPRFSKQCHKTQVKADEEKEKEAPINKIEKTKIGRGRERVVINQF